MTHKRYKMHKKKINNLKYFKKDNIKYKKYNKIYVRY